MTEEVHIGEVIKYIRKEKNMTQQRLADGICSTKYLRALEKGQYSPSTYIVTLLSRRLGSDLYSQYIIIKEHNGIISHKAMQKLESYMDPLDISHLESLVTIYEKLPEFQYGEPQQLIYYIKCLIYKHKYKNDAAAIQFCKKGLGIFQKNLDFLQIQDSMCSHIELVLLNCLATLYYEVGKHDQCNLILEAILSNLENTMNSQICERKDMLFVNKIFCISCYNLSNASYLSGDYNDALSYADRGILFSIKNSDAKYMPYLLMAKIQACFANKDSKVAIRCYQDAKMLCNLYHWPKVLDILDDMISSDEFSEFIPLIDH